MQFRRAGKRIQILAYDGYDNDKKRAIVKMLGSISAYAHDGYGDPSVGLLEKLTDQQNQELTEYIEKRQTEDKSETQRLYIKTLPRDILGVINALKIEANLEHLDADLCNDIYAQFDELSKVMRKAGFKRPVRKKKAVANEKQQALKI